MTKKPKQRKQKIFGAADYGEELELGGIETLSGPDRKMIEKGGWPSKLPKKKRGGPEESYRPFSGYKGHR